MGPEIEASSEVKEHAGEEPRVLEEIAVEELSIDGICGVYGVLDPGDPTIEITEKKTC